MISAATMTGLIRQAESDPDAFAVLEDAAREMGLTARAFTERTIWIVDRSTTLSEPNVKATRFEWIDGVWLRRVIARHLEIHTGARWVRVGTNCGHYKAGFGEVLMVKRSRRALRNSRDGLDIRCGVTGCACGRTLFGHRDDKPEKDPGVLTMGVRVSAR